MESKENIGQANVESRLAFWEAATRMSLDRPLFGIGPGRFGAVSDEYLRNNPLDIPDPVVHNSYLEILAENGIFALIAFVALLLAAWRAVGRAESESRRLGDLRRARLAAAIKGTLVVAVVSGIFLSEQLTLPFWLACGLAGSGALWVARSSAVQPAVRPAVAFR